MHDLIRWFTSSASILAAIVTCGVAILLYSCLSCSNCAHREKDEIFTRKAL